MARTAVAVVGPGVEGDPQLLAAAEHVGAGLARAGYAVVTGGLDGVMAAASRGASNAGGLVIGILPGDRTDAANEWVDVAVPTGMGEGRNIVVVRSAAAVVAVGGSWGTLSEIALARRRGIPVVSLHGWRVDGPDADDNVKTVTDAEAAVREVVALLS